jgi:hypothetical protein
VPATQRAHATAEQQAAGRHRGGVEHRQAGNAGAAESEGEPGESGPVEEGTHHPILTTALADNWSVPLTRA